ncbi:DsbA family oxidoreductase [Streptomyces sp. enrichment culture]|uniref:DsbA family oxidoreductase n=1 Tax=Streptomyces sp. enrichment culture TaxID=1795815 RepID=UPI003F56937D
MRVDIWSDISCPWCFIGKARFEQALADFAHHEAVEVVHRSFELDPHLTQTRPTTGEEHAKKYGMTPAQAREAEEGIARVAKEEGLGYLVDHRDHGNTFDMHRLLHLAATRGVADELLSLFYEGNFATARSIYEPTHQIELAVRAGLDEDEVRAVLADERAYAGQVRKDEAEAARLGVTGVPFFVVDGKYGLSGAQPTEAFAEVLERAWADRETSLTVVGGAADGGCDAEGACDLPSPRR